MMTPARFVAPVALTLAVTALAGCGANAGSADLDLTPRGEDGRKIANSNGCAACHGSEGEGGVGPTFVGLFGSEVELDDGTTVTATEEYLRESITMPDTKKVAGYRLPMPANDLSREEVDAVVDYIVELADEGTGE